ncbi:MAG: hypothetical protein AAGI48_01715 [Verrucomicrobiota bacterium]
MKAKTRLMVLALVAGLIPGAQAAPYLVPNGDFSTPAGENWRDDGAPGTVISYPASGGNTGGHGKIDNTAGTWGGVLVNEGGVGPNPASGAGIPLGSIGNGLNAGETYNFSIDLIDFGPGGTMAGMKIEAFDEVEIVGDSGDVNFATTTSWDTYTFEYTIPATATRLKFVPVVAGQGDGVGNIGYDNVGGDDTPITTPPLPAGGIPNGDFEIPAGANWGTTQGTPTFPTMDGNPDGNTELDGTGPFTVLYAFDNAEVTFDSLGLSPGDNYIFQVDMKIISGSNIGGIRLEGPSGYVVESYPTLIGTGATWETYQIELTVPAMPAQAKFGLRPGGGSVVAFDNAGIFVPAVEPFVAEIKTGNVVSWTPPVPTDNYQPQQSEDGINFTDLGPLIVGDSVSSTFDAEPSMDYQVLQYEQTSTELLGDPGFELGDFSWVYFIAANMDGNPETVFEINDSGLARSGDWCIRMLVDTGVTTTPSTALIQQSLGAGTVMPGDTLDLSFWANVEVAPVGGTIFNYSVKWRDINDIVIGQVDGNFNTPVGVWTEVVVPGLVAPANTDKAIVEIGAVTGASAGDTGQVLIDDTSLSGLDSTLLPTPLTATVADGVQICFPTDDGSSYQPKTSPNLTDPFINFGPSITGDGSVMSVFDTITMDRNFYLIEETP